MERGEAASAEREAREMREQEMEVPEEVGWRAEEEEGGAPVAIAATEDLGEDRRNWSPCYRRVAEWCNVILMGLVVGFACIFAYAWVEAFSKVRTERTQKQKSRDVPSAETKFCGAIQF